MVAVTRISESVFVTAINVAARQLYFADGSVCAIASLLDSDGDETQDIGQATAAVAQVPSGGWIVAELADFMFPTRH